jgi:hypothetical protein
MRRSFADGLTHGRPGVAKRSIGHFRLRGKESEIELGALAAAAATTRASGEVAALSSR